MPWRIVLFVEGLFLLIAAISQHGGLRFLTHLVGHSELATTATGAVTSNAVNNLPAYLAIEPAVPAENTSQLLAALIGTNAGPLILLWGSLQPTLLWRDRCRARGVHVSAWYLRLGRSRRRSTRPAQQLGRFADLRLSRRFGHTLERDGLTGLSREEIQMSNSDGDFPDGVEDYTAVDGAENFDPIDNLTGDDPDESMQTGYSPPDREPYNLRHPVTATEERDGPSLDEWLAAEVPEDTGVWTESQPRVGRLVAPDEGAHEDEESDAIGEDVGPAGYAASAEEAAMHLIPEE